MIVVSSFGEQINELDFHVKSFELYTDPGLNIEYDFNDNIIKNWSPGHDIYVHLELSGSLNDSSTVVLNWYCPETHFRGGIHAVNEDNNHNYIELEGRVDGNSIRKVIKFQAQVLNGKGFITSTFYSQSIILEGNRSYFPIGICDFEAKYRDALCAVNMSSDTDPDELFTQTVCRALINNNGGLYNSMENNVTSYLPSERFLQYEIWRQKLEIALNNENFKSFIDAESDDDFRIGVVWSHMLIRIFPKSSLTEIKLLRKNSYPDFCKTLQAYFFKNFEGYM